MACSLGCSHTKSHPGGHARIAFVTANLVARVSGYGFELVHWGEQDKKTIAATDAATWRSICREISATGFRAVEIWEAVRDAEWEWAGGEAEESPKTLANNTLLARR